MLVFNISFIDNKKGEKKSDLQWFHKLFLLIQAPIVFHKIHPGIQFCFCI
jgi:hypothetical protein